MLVVGFGFSQLFVFVFPSLGAEYLNASLFRPWSDPLMSLYFLHPFLVGVILVWIWTKTKQLFIGTQFERAYKFGFVYALLAFPGMLISYASFPVSFLMVLSWFISSILQGLVAGLLFTKIIK